MRPYDYQQDTARWLADRDASICSLDVGMGKTLSAYLAIVRNLETLNLVLCPTNALALQWFNEIQTYTENLEGLSGQVLAAHKRTEKSADAHLKFHRVNVNINGMGYAFYIGTHAQLLDTPAQRNKAKDNGWMTPAKWIASQKWDSVTVDEAHESFLNHRGQRFKALGKVKRERLAALTATPTGDVPYRVFGLLRLCGRQRFSSYWYFVERYFEVRLEEQYAKGGERRMVRRIYDFHPDKASEFEALVAEYALVRTWEDVGKQLPPLNLNTITLTPNPVFVSAYNKLKEETIVQLREEAAANKWDLSNIATLKPIIIDNASKRFMLLRRFATSPDAFDSLQVNRKYEVLDRWTAAGHTPGVVLTYFRETVDLIKDHLHKTGQPVNDDANGERDPDKWFVGTLSKYAAGVNLQKWSGQFFFDLPMSSVVYQQALGRLRRLGRETEVPVFIVTTKGTVEEHLDQLVNGKRSLNLTILEWLREITKG